jgi:hypothetical protein
MVFGKRYLELNGKRPERPLFSARERIIVFDVHNVLVLQKGAYENGRRTGPDIYVVHQQAEEVVSAAIRDFDRVVLWSSHREHLEQLHGKPFDDVSLCIAGGMVVNDNLIKDLRILSPDKQLRNVVALEDADVYFDPLGRVIPVERHGNLAENYTEARALVFRHDGQ